MTTCPYCKDSVSEREAVYCPSCEAAHHLDCWDANHGACSVYGCEPESTDRVLGCPWCEEVYPTERRVCMLCNSPLMSSEDCINFVQSHDWIELPLDAGWNAALTAGYLRNSGLIARVEKKAPVSMFRIIAQKAKVLVSAPQYTEATHVLQELSERLTNCPDCGHVLYIEEKECSFCAD